MMKVISGVHHTMNRCQANAIGLDVIARVAMADEHEYEASRERANDRPERLRPRRLEPDTLSYFKEVTEMLVQPTEDTTAEDTEMLLWNVLEELAPRAASASSDRHAGEMVDIFLPRMNDGQLRFFFSKMTGYFSHLWTNRYSSHVLQHLLSRASAVIEKEVNGSTDASAEDDERLKDTPSMSELIVAMVKEVEAEWMTLINDVSASHVLRSVLAVLAGKPLVPEKRGKNAKHRTVTFGEALNKDGTAVTFDVPESFPELFNEYLNTFMTSPEREMFNLMYDRNAGPVIAAALKLAPKETQTTLAEHLLKWDNEKASAGVFYDYAGDLVASHFLEALFTVVDDDFFADIFRRCLQGKLIEFAQHEIANYVVQNALQRVRTTDLATEVFAELEQTMWTLLSMGRAGVVWRLVELSSTQKMRQQEIYVALMEAVKKQESKKPEAVRKAFVPAMLQLQLSTTANAKLKMNVTGAKIIAQLMQFEHEDWLMPLFKEILSLNVVQLIALAKDSTGSRFVIEPLWEMSDQATAWVRTELFEKFSGQFGTLALDRFGAFSVIKCYEKMNLRQKAEIAEELVKVENKLAGCHFAQLVLNTCHLHEFKTNRDKWNALYEKKAKIVELFKDMVGGDADAAPGKEKKSKKHKKSKTKEENVALTSSKKRKHRGESPENNEDVATIMDALRNGGKAQTDKKKKKKKRRSDDSDDE